MAVLEIRDLHVTVETDAGTTPILNGVTLTGLHFVPVRAFLQLTSRTVFPLFRGADSETRNAIPTGEGAKFRIVRHIPKKDCFIDRQHKELQYAQHSIPFHEWFAARLRPSITQGR